VSFPLEPADSPEGIEVKVEEAPGRTSPISAESGTAQHTTVGTGSVLGIGCLVAVVLLVVIAFAFRLLGGTW